MIKAKINLSIDEMSAPHGSFAEYAIAWAYTTFHLPKNTTFEEVSLSTKE
jgi:NADPH:quinone reductase-like Zn-dependent oxidoreductase